MLFSKAITLSFLALVPYAATQDFEDHGLQVRDIEDEGLALLVRRAVLAELEARAHTAPPKAKAKAPAGKKASGKKGLRSSGGSTAGVSQDLPCSVGSMCDLLTIFCSKEATVPTVRITQAKAFA